MNESITNLPAARLRLIGGSLCLDFANTVGGRRCKHAGKKRGVVSEVLGDKISEYDSLIGWGWHTGVIGEKETRRARRATSRSARFDADLVGRAIALRESIYRIFKANADGDDPAHRDLELLNREIAEALLHQRLKFSGRGFSWEWMSGDPAERVLWEVARSASELLTSGDLSRVRDCGGPDCGWLFLDSSRNKSRQWCHMQSCGNLAKVRRFRQRQRRKSKSR